MKIKIEDTFRDILIERKKTNKNTYIRVKEDLNIYVTTNYLLKEKEILKLVNDNKLAIERMLKKQILRNKNKEVFSYLGKKYDIVYINTNEVILGEDKLLINRCYDIDKWLQKKAINVFKIELDKVYNDFPVKIPYPTLTIRKMKTRWGVCNVRTCRVTLNLELIKKDIKYLDYVVAHELSHLVYPNHSKDFWALVERVIPNYRVLRKEMRDYE